MDIKDLSKLIIMGWLCDVYNAVTGAARDAWDWLTGDRASR